MIHRTKRSGLALLIALAGVASLMPAHAADFDQVVLLANEDLFAGYNDVWGFVGSNGREYVIQGTVTGTAWWDVEDPSNPVLVTFLEEPVSTWRDMFVIGDYCFITAENNDMGVRVVDISDPTNPRYVASYLTTVNQAHNVFGDPARNLIYVVGGSSNGANGGLQILDASDPLNMVEIGQWNDHYTHDMSIEGNLGYLCLILFDQLQIVDLSDPTNPTSLGTYNSPVGSVHASWPAGDGQHVMITHETQGGHLRAIDVSDSLNPTLAGVWNPAPSASAHNVHVQGNLAWVSWYARGTRVIDITNPQSMSEVGYWDTTTQTAISAGNWGVYPHLPSGVVASNDREHGLFLLKYDATSGVLDGIVTPQSGSFAFGASVEYVDLAMTQAVDSTGAYRFSAFSGPSHSLRFEAFGFEPDSATVALAPDGTTTTDVILTRLPAGGLAGTIADAQSFFPLASAEAAVLGTPLVGVTDASGQWSLPDVPVGSYTLEVRAGGYVSETIPITVVIGQTTNVPVGLEPAAVFVNFSSTPGWTEDNDPGVIGSWVFDDPFGTFLGGEIFQPEDDHTPAPDTICAVTGNGTDGVDDGDVDDGATRLLSPVYDLSSMVEPHVLYYRWYATEGSQDAWEVEVSPNGGTSWILIESSTADERFWKGVDTNLGEVLSVFDAVRFRFTAQDHPPETILEAALDDFTLYDAGPGSTSGPLPGADSSPGLALLPGAPNPFAEETTIRFVVPKTGRVQLVVHDVRGARVATLMDRDVAPGAHSVVWDGKTTTGRSTAPGIYFVELRHDGQRRSEKILRQGSAW